MAPRIHPIRARRDALGLRMVRVAADAGISVQALWAIETGRTQSPSLDVARRLAGALDTDVDSLFPASEEPAA